MSSKGELLRSNERLRAEIERLRRENERLQDALRYLPPESFLVYYSLLVEAVYTTRLPAPEAKTHCLRRWGMVIPVRDYRAYRMLRQVDQSLYRLTHAIREYFSGEVDVDARPRGDHRVAAQDGSRLPEQDKAEKHRRTGSD